MSQRQAAARPDNNRRLAKLEAGVASLAIALSANGFDLPEGTDPIVAAITAAKDTASLRAQVAQLADFLLANHPDAIGDNAGAIPTAIKVIEQLKATSLEESNDGQVATLKQQLAELQEAVANGGGADAIAGLEDQIDALERTVAVRDARIKELEAGAPVIVETVAPDSAAEPEAPALVRPEAARDVGPDYAGILKSGEIRDLLNEGGIDGLEVAFSNGDYEIVGMEPVKIGPEDLQLFEGRNLVAPAIHAQLAIGDPPVVLHGFGLMLQGEQVGYCPLLDQIRLNPGEEHRFQRVIFF